MFFIDEIEQPLTRKRKIFILAMIAAFIPIITYALGHREWMQSDLRRAALPIEIALPADLPNIYK